MEKGCGGTLDDRENLLTYVARAIKLGISSKALVISKQAWNRKIDLPEPKENQAFPSIIGLGVS